MKRVLFVLFVSMALVSCSEKPEQDSAQKKSQKAEPGEAEAQIERDELHDKTDRVIEDDTESVNLSRKAAEQGDPDAQTQLGMMYENGDGVIEDDTEAVKWYLKAAEQGDIDALVQLGVMYANGESVKEDYVEAYKWTLLAEMNGEDVTDCKNFIKDEMSPDQIAEAQDRANAYAAEMETKSERVN
jgi:TPR repeat protein